MDITKKRDGKTLEIALDGRLDTLSAPLLEAELRKDLDGVNTLICDFTNVTYISSAGIRTMVLAQRLMGEDSTVKVTNAGEVVREIFTVTGLADLLLADE